jgi:hypothetical protein
MLLTNRKDTVYHQDYEIKRFIIVFYIGMD